MAHNHAISTMAAMASRNTKAANRAKASMKRFRTAVTKILNEVEESDADTLDSVSVADAIKRVKADATEVLTDLHGYSEEITATKASDELYNSLLTELKGYLDKIDAVQSRLSMVESDPSEATASNETPTVVKSVKIASSPRETAQSSNVQRQLQQQLAPPSFISPIDSTIFNERSEQISHLRSSVYDIHDIYVQIGDIAEQQGDQLDNIEMNMIRTLGDTLETNVAIQNTADRESTSWRHRFVICVLLLCLIVIIFKYRSL
ncbi:putative integral membrane protein [Babesia bovis T2Bo]|uniref:putative integral membrane protein n=1 Tax=Babesia bovis T2Bo TaxID=484906 RepID=UPI001C34E870|nr:putative integral membrane protein [Babesia bovis T2Bo]EDO06616.2 putative integral membrane protein [Babesia bovis T2Bo]